MLRQVLIEAGFHVEYVPGFKSYESRTIYVPEAEFTAAAEFLGQYLNTPLDTN